VASSPDRLLTGNADVWDSGRKDSAESVDIAYAGPDLQSRRRYYWKIRAWDIAGHVSESLESTWWQMGILHPADWTAKWIAWENPEDQADRKGIRWIWVKGQDALAAVPKTSATFRVNIRLTEKPRDAVLLLAVRGDFTAKVSGREVGSKREWGAFDRRDITDELIVGQNSIEVHLTAPDVPRRGPNTGAKNDKGRPSSISEGRAFQRFRDAHAHWSSVAGEPRKLRPLGAGLIWLAIWQTSASAIRGRCHSQPPTFAESYTGRLRMGWAVTSYCWTCTRRTVPMTGLQTESFSFMSRILQ
jgi:hypothetical protein